MAKRERRVGSQWRWLSDEEVRTIRDRIHKGESAASLAREYGASEANISRIRSGKIHKALLQEQK